MKQSINHLTTKISNKKLVLAILFIPLIYVFKDASFKEISIFFIGVLLGATLNYFLFGFRTCSNLMLEKGKTIGVRSVLILFGVSTLLFFPLINMGEFNGNQLFGYVQPLSLSIVIGAFAFGIGMQLAGSCTSGTLNRIGKLHPLSLTSLAFLLIGGTLAAYHNEFWRSMPALPSFSLLKEFGLWNGIFIQLSLIVFLYFSAILLEKYITKQVEPLYPKKQAWNPLTWHAWLQAIMLLAILNTLLLLVSGSPWSIANIFPIWGLKLAELFSLPIEWGFWDYSITNMERMERTILQDTVSLTTLGLIFGAFMVTMLSASTKSYATTTKVNYKVDYKQHAYAIVGGLIMGYGSVIAFGCNIGALFSGIASGSLHGWLWGISALAGNGLIIFLRARVVNSY